MCPRRLSRILPNDTVCQPSIESSHTWISLLRLRLYKTTRLPDCMQTSRHQKVTWPSCDIRMVAYDQHWHSRNMQIVSVLQRTQAFEDAWTSYSNTTPGRSIAEARSWHPWTQEATVSYGCRVLLTVQWINSSHLHDQQNSHFQVYEPIHTPR